MLKRVLLTGVWCVFASYAGYLLLPGMVGIVGAIVAPIAVLIMEITKTEIKS